MRLEETRFTKLDRIQKGIYSGLVIDQDGPSTTIFWTLPNKTTETFTVDLYGDKPELFDFVDFRRYSVSPTCVCSEIKGRTPSEFWPTGMLAKMDTNILRAMQEKSPETYKKLQELSEQQPG